MSENTQTQSAAGASVWGGGRGGDVTERRVPFLFVQFASL